MSNDQYKQRVLGALDEIAVNSRIEPILASVDESVRLGQAVHQQRKAWARARFLIRLRAIEGSKWQANGRCECGGDHYAIELLKGNEVVETICPYTYWHRICALLIERRGGSAMLKWTRSHPRSHFVRPITE